MADGKNGDLFLFTSESVGEGHPGEQLTNINIDLYKIIAGQIILPWKRNHGKVVKVCISYSFSLPHGQSVLVSFRDYDRQQNQLRVKNAPSLIPSLHEYTSLMWWFMPWGHTCTYCTSFI